MVPAGELFHSLRWIKRYCRWTPTSKEELEVAERRILNYIEAVYNGQYVNIGSPSINGPSKKWSRESQSEERKMWTLSFNGQNTSNSKTPLVLVHGLCAASGLWALNIDSLANARPVHTIDLLGFGRSSRPKFSKDATEAESQHVEAFETWRQKMKLDRFVLLGHSMGGFISTSYSLKYPDCVAHLVLADPWGFPQKPEEVQDVLSKRSRLVRVLVSMALKMNPAAIIRGAGPFGPRLLPGIDLIETFQALNQNGAASVAEYAYHCNAQKPTGEEAFRAMMDFFFWAKNPMQNRLQNLVPEVPVTLIYGEKTWLPNIPPEELVKLRPNGFIQVYTIPGADHLLFADDQRLFNSIVNDGCELADKLFQQNDIVKNI